MTCEQVRDELAAFLREEVSPKARQAMERHLASCPACSEELEGLRRTWGLLGLWEDEILPEGVVVSLLERARRKERESSRRRGFLNGARDLTGILQPLAPFAMGLATAILSAVILSTRLNLDQVPHLALTTAGALWTALYGLVFYVFKVGTKRGMASWRFMAQASLVAVGIFLALTAISPLPSSVTFCSHFRLTQPLIERLSIGGSFFLFGGLYALIPMGIAAYLAGGERRDRTLVQGSLAGAVFVLLLAPSIFLHCAPFALGTLVGWFGGALVGSVIGGSIGSWVRYRLARA